MSAEAEPYFQGAKPRVMWLDEHRLELKPAVPVWYDEEGMARLVEACERASRALGEVLRPVLDHVNQVMATLGPALQRLHRQLEAAGMLNVEPGESDERRELWEDSGDAYRWSAEAGDELIEAVRSLG